MPQPFGHFVVQLWDSRLAKVASAWKCISAKHTLLDEQHGVARDKRLLEVASPLQVTHLSPVGSFTSPSVDTRFMVSILFMYILVGLL